MKNPNALTRGFVNDALRRYAVWDLGNQALYDLCSRNPGHHRIDEIAAKVWLVGRSYAAAIERGAQTVEGEDFYVERVAPAMRSARIDRWLAPLSRLKGPEAAVVVPAHRRLTELFREISTKNKRSLASKYLHFHFPKAVYIFDARASRAIRQVTRRHRAGSLSFDLCDEAYARFFLRCRAFHDELEQLTGRALTPREVDNVLLAVAERG